MSLREQLAEKGVSCEALDDEKIKAVPREVEIVEYKGALYAKTESFAVPHKYDPNKTQQARNLFIRVEALDQAIQDLMIAKGQVDAADEDDE